MIIKELKNESRVICLVIHTERLHLVQEHSRVVVPFTVLTRPNIILFLKPNHFHHLKIKTCESLRE